ncbi:hypothetical protein AN958_11127 [Leucoagaricus sp. SymC.cos]|nr:hypothetical protein AN958_11127 [Leucoagaricus sp. SymC.cos]
MRDHNKIQKVEPIEASQVTPNDVIILLLGPTGSGKSTFIRTVTIIKNYDSGEVTHDMQSGTCEVSAVRVKFPDNQHVVLVDTPGLESRLWRDSEILEAVARVVGLTGSGKSTFIHQATGRRFGKDDINHTLRSSLTGPRAVRIGFSSNVPPVVLVDTPGFDPTDGDDVKTLESIREWRKAAATRARNETLDMLKDFQKTCGENLNRIIALPVTTMWPEEEEESQCMSEYENREKIYLDECWRPIYGKKSNGLRFKNTTSSAWEIINHIIDDNEAAWEALFPTITIEIARQLANLQRRDPKKISTIEPIIDTITEGRYDNVEVDHGLQSATNEIKAVRVEFHDRINVVLVETPGFDNTRLSDYEVLRRLVEWLDKLGQHNMKVTGMLYLQRISDNRMPASPFKDPGWFRKIFGEHFFENIVLTTTMWPAHGTPDVEETKTYVDRENGLKNDYWNEMIAGGSIVCRFQNTPRSAWDIINHLISINTQKAWARIRPKLMEEATKLVETKGGREAVKKLVKKLAELLKRIESVGALESTDSGAAEDVLKHLSEFQQMRSKALQEIRRIQPDSSLTELLKHLIAFFTRKFSGNARTWQAVGFYNEPMAV